MLHQIPIDAVGATAAEVYPLVVARRRSTAGRRGQKEGGAPWRHVAGGPTAPTHPHLRIHVPLHSTFLCVSPISLSLSLSLIA